MLVLFKNLKLEVCHNISNISSLDSVTNLIIKNCRKLNDIHREFNDKNL